MDYQVKDPITAMPLDVMELHVLARAYYAAWRVMHGAPPQGWHFLPTLQVMIEYDIPPLQVDSSRTQHIGR